MYTSYFKKAVYYIAICIEFERKTTQHKFCLLPSNCPYV